MRTLNNYYTCYVDDEYFKNINKYIRTPTSITSSLYWKYAIWGTQYVSLGH